MEFKYTEDRKHIDLVHPNVFARWEVTSSGLQLVDFADEFSTTANVVRASAKASLEAARWHRSQQRRQQLRELADELRWQREVNGAIEDERRHNASLRWPS